VGHLVDAIEVTLVTFGIGDDEDAGKGSDVAVDINV